MLKWNSVFFALAMVGALGCATGAELPVDRPGIRIAQASTSEFIQERGGSFAVEYLLEVRNTADIPITAEWVELQTAAGSPYAIRQRRTNIKQAIPANSTKVIKLSVWAHSFGGSSAAREPVTLKALVGFRSEKGSFQVRENARFNQ